MLQLDNPAYGKLKPSSGGSGGSILGTKTITQNGTYNATDDNLDGYSQVNVSTSGVDVDEYFYNTIGYESWEKVVKKLPAINFDGNNCKGMFELFYGEEINFNNNFNTSSVRTMESMFGYCSSLNNLNLSGFDTSNLTNMNRMFFKCSSLTSLNLGNFNTSNVTDISYIFSQCSSLTNITGCLQNLGQAYNTTESANYSSYTLYLLDSSKLTHDSLMNIINGLYDIATKGCNTQSLNIGSTNVAKLTAEEIAVATNKGWTVS